MANSSRLATLADEPANLADISINPPLRKWRNWQTHQLEGLGTSFWASFYKLLKIRRQHPL